MLAYVHPMSKSSIAERFFSERELNNELGISSDDGEMGATSLWEWLEALQTWTPTKRWLPLDGTYFRGQSDSSFGLTNSLYRTIRQSKAGRVGEADLAEAEQRAILAAREEGIGRKMTDGELLAVLQHHQMPTRLIDVSAASKEALYFAVESNDGTDGRLFLLHPHAADRQALRAPTPFVFDKESGVSAEKQLDVWRAVPWTGAVRGEKQSVAEWTARVAVISDYALDPRMRAQLGHFLVGGIHARYRGMKMTIGGHNVPVEEAADITTLSIHFPSFTKNSAAHQSWPASGWSIRVKASWKPFLRDRLKSDVEPIDLDAMYPPILEAKRLVLRRTRNTL